MTCRTQRISHFAFSLKAIGANWAASPRAINVKGSTSNSLISECRSGAFDVNERLRRRDFALVADWSDDSKTVEIRACQAFFHVYQVCCELRCCCCTCSDAAFLLEQTLLLQFSWKKKNHGNKKWIFLDLNSTHIVWTDRPSAARLISFYTFLFFFFWSVF